MKLFGEPGKAFFDGWTIVHICCWVVVAANFDSFKVPMLPYGFGIIFLGTLVWEVIETCLEKWTDWVNVHEGPWNRWVSDPLMGFVGGAIGYWVV